MDVKLINPFLAASMHVLKTMAGVDARPGKPFLKKTDEAVGDVSAIIGITGAAKGSMALVFTEKCIKEIASSLLGEVLTELNPEVRDAVGELTNMICGDARRRLSEEGFALQAGIPTVVAGKNHTITHIADGPRLAVPFETDHGSFMVEVAFARSG
ncbi:MAG TPA: chemotaxis protein CheX [Syntrophobacteraceae bacterium]|nr:chemotaxis protein CheX [Syntrophobacteraceae bacterium]